MEEKRRPGLLGYFTLALMTTAIVVCILLMILLKQSSLTVMLGTLPVLLVIDWLGHRLELSMGDHLPTRIWDGLIRLVIWAAAVLVMWTRYKPDSGVFTPDFALLLLVIVEALTLLLRVIHAMGDVKEPKPPKAPKLSREERKAQKEAEKKAEQEADKPAEAPVPVPQPEEQPADK